MKYLLVLFIAISLFGKVDIELGSYYDSNVLTISDDDIDQFKDGLAPEKFDISAVDDLVNKISGSYSYSYKVFGHTQILTTGCSGNIYLENSVKSSYSLSASLKQYLAKGVSFTLGYRYSPENYVNRYRSVVDQNLYRMEYEKESLSLRYSHKLLEFLKIEPSFEIGRGFYNRYFTEYDNSYYQWGLGGRYYFNDYISLGGTYIYKSLECDGKDAYDFTVSQIKDGSYELNRYSASISMKGDLIEKSLEPFTVSLKYSFEEKFYINPIVGDDFHNGREDYLSTISTKLSYNMGIYTIGLNFKSYSRKTDSIFEVVESEKGYSRYSSGVSLKIRL
jgi:hypothetical protein